MYKMLHTRTLLTRSRTLFNGSKRCMSSIQPQLSEKDVEEIRIPVPWGHIAGKWWGDKNTSPILGLHGWQDNANTFDTLIPLLNVSSFLAIDAPGHGLSSHLPPGRVYNFLEYIFVIRRIVKYFSWKEFSILGHSMGAVTGYVYSSIHPEEIKCLMSFECARSLVMMYTMDIAANVSSGIDKLLKIDKQMQSLSPPSYRLSDMLRMYSEGSMGSISPDSALILLKRGAYQTENVAMSKVRSKPSGTDLKDFVNHEIEQAGKKSQALEKTYANVIDNQMRTKEKLESFNLEDSENKFYVFTRDPRTKVNALGMFNEELLNECAKNIKCPVLSMRAADGFLHGTGKKTYESTVKILQENCRYFEHHEVKGSHHGHLNTPEFVAPVINNFLRNMPSS